MGRYYSGDINDKFLFGLEDSLGSLEYGGEIQLIFEGIVWDNEEDRLPLSMSRIVDDIVRLLNTIEKDYTKENLESIGVDPSNGTYTFKYSMEEYVGILNSLKDSISSLVKEITEETYKEFVSQPEKIDKLRIDTTELLVHMSHVHNTETTKNWWVTLPTSLPTALNVCHYLSSKNKGKDIDPYYYGTCQFTPEL